MAGRAGTRGHCTARGMERGKSAGRYRHQGDEGQAAEGDSKWKGAQVAEGQMGGQASGGKLWESSHLTPQSSGSLQLLSSLQRWKGVNSRQSSNNFSCTKSNYQNFILFPCIGSNY